MVSAFSVPKAKRDQKLPTNPGPGQYNPETSPKVVKKSDPLYSFGKEERRENNSPNPGPGSYQPRNSTVNEQSPSYSLGVRKQQKEDWNTIGPGQYEPKSEVNKQKSPAYSLYGRAKDQDLRIPLGPGQYDLKRQLDQVARHGIKFTRDRRDNIDKRVVPGPGSYEFEGASLKYGSKQQPSYGFGSKIEPLSQSQIPGPGQYDGQVRVYSKIGGIMSRDLRRSMVESRTPGPGNYNPEDGKFGRKQPQWSLSKSSRNTIDRGGSLGPGQYEQDRGYKSVLQSSPGYHFGSEKKLKNELGRVPGPGTYEQNLLQSHKSVKIGQRIKDLSKSQVPGPGSYEQDKYNYESWIKGGGRYSLGKSARETFERSIAPGPGAYDQLGNKSRQGKVTFGRDLRLKEDKNANPGPGQYQLKPFFADVPKYLLPNKA